MGDAKVPLRKQDEAPNDQDLQIGANGSRPNCIVTIDEQEARLLEGADREPSPALVQAFEIRRQNRAKSRTAK